jgi:hypothetical protein
VTFFAVVYLLIFCRLESLEQFVWFDDDQLASSLMETTVQSAPHQVIDKENAPSYEGREPGEV